MLGGTISVKLVGCLWSKAPLISPPRGAPRNPVTGCERVSGQTYGSEVTLCLNIRLNNGINEQSYRFRLGLGNIRVPQFGTKGVVEWGASRDRYRKMANLNRWPAKSRAKRKEIKRIKLA
ncbi:hypothetical protein K0M31_013903 [Melipona bicolor]|uniref:Uncharacterized protein n=1 Tax=Melipona bicolor TaxID=60889 RepID=A0AA40G7R0_9HYME|nr:hypothetical protein K0M31_013903 [Melipona bicolor]